MVFERRMDVVHQVKVVEKAKLVGLLRRKRYLHSAGDQKPHAKQLDE